ncbi:MAG: NADH-quinone oxidoreductase subunit H [Candidatus Saelkia tenebricola]|nr:NADH-quinone oxidoreductase subunit H [Candidatus Saelkia tenebricola]
MNFYFFRDFFFSCVWEVFYPLDRKVTARIQYRVGPPWYQSFADLLKLFGKETLIPKNSSVTMFMLAPFLGMSALLVSGFILYKINLFNMPGFLGDLIVMVYLFTIPSLSLILGGFASSNPLSSLGSSREIKLLLGYELPFMLAILVPVIQTGSIRFSEIIQFQIEHGAVLYSISGSLAFIAVLLSVQAKMGLVPFDVAEAETEILSGPLTEYSGPLLGIFKLNKMLMFSILPLFVLSCFWGGFGNVNPLINILKFLTIVVIFTLIRNTNPRLRVDQALRFFWFKLSVISSIAVILALGGM